MRVDVHQHVWTDTLVDALASRRSLPRVVRVGGEALLQLKGEPSYVIDLAAEAPSPRRQLVEDDGLDLALLAISSPIGIEALPRDEANLLIGAHLAGAAALGPRFGFWGPVALDRPDPDDVDRLLDRGCVGISLPAGAIATPARLAQIAPLLTRVADDGAPLFVHPGPSPADLASAGAPAEIDAPRWWTPLTSYVSQMQAAWLSFAAFGRRQYPHLTVLFAMLAGAAPLLAERLAGRGGPPIDLRDPLTFYDTSSFGRAAVDAMATQVGAEQLVYGSDRPVVDPVPGDRDPLLQENGARLIAAMGCMR